MYRHYYILEINKIKIHRSVILNWVNYNKLRYIFHLGFIFHYLLIWYANVLEITLARIQKNNTITRSILI